MADGRIFRRQLCGRLIESYRNSCRYSKQGSPPFSCVVDELQIVEALDQMADRDLGFEPRKMGAEAEMRTAAE